MNILMLMAVTKPIICKVDQIQSILLHAHKSMGKGQDNEKVMGCPNIILI
jgi:hypothetical protein